MSNMSSKTVSEIEISALLDAYVYMDQQSEAYTGKSLNEIMILLPPESKSSDEYKALKAAIAENPEIGNLELVHQSMPSGHQKELVIACTFKDPATDSIYVAFRGTGDGKWVDNGEGITAESTVMQDASVAYFDDVMEDLGLTAQKNGRVIVTGHSKGGNEAQFTTLTAEHKDLIDNCYSIDGQGFSDEAIARFKTELGDDYQKYLDKMYSINGESDYVHDLGNVIIDETHTYFIKPTKDGNPHSILILLDDDKLNWTRDQNGNIVYGEQAFLGILAKNVSENLMALPEIVRDDCAITVMWLVEVILPYNDKIGGEYFLGTGHRKAPNIVELVVCLRLLGPFAIASLFEGLYDYTVMKIEDFVASLKEFFTEKLDELKEWFDKNFNRSRQYLESNDTIRIDTIVLRGYADRISEVNRRLKNLDGKMDALYTKVGLLDMADLATADILTGHSWRLTRCISYLNETASDFESSENAIALSI